MPDAPDEKPLPVEKPQPEPVTNIDGENVAKADTDLTVNTDPAKAGDAPAPDDETRDPLLRPSDMPEPGSPIQPTSCHAGVGLPNGPREELFEPVLAPPVYVDDQPGAPGISPI